MDSLSLNESEKSILESNVPIHQARIHLMFRCDVVYNNKEYKNSLLALSEHMITICSYRYFGLKISELACFHFFNIKSVDVDEDKVHIILSNEDDIIIITSLVDKFIKTFIRNYALASALIPGMYKFKLSLSDKSIFPKNKPLLSPTQMFQFVYNAYCSFYEASYVHEVVCYYHKLLMEQDCVFDLNKIPMTCLESGLGGEISIDSLFSSLMFSDYIYGLNCDDISKEEIIQESFSLILMNKNLRFLRLINTGAQNGCLKLANSILENPYTQIIYWDLSYNCLEDFPYFLSALGEIESYVQCLILNYCGLTDSDISVLFNSLINSKYLWTLRRLSLLDSRINNENMELFSDYIESLDLQCLEEIEIGPLTNPLLLIKVLSEWTGKLRVLKIINTNFDINSQDAFLMLIQSSQLEELDISGCYFNDEFLEKLFLAITENENILSIKLFLNKLKLNGKNLNNLLTSISNLNLEKIKFLSFDENYFSKDDLSILIPFLVKLPKIEGISLSYNFKKNTNVSNEIVKLLKINTLKKLIVKGNEKYYLQNEALDILNSINDGINLEYLDLSGNQFGDYGYKLLSNIIKNNQKLKYLFIDNENPTQIGSIIEYMNLISSSSTLIDCALPRDDLYYLLSKCERTVFERINTLQNLMEQRLFENRSKIGLKTDLSLLNDQILNNIINEIEDEMKQKLDGVKINEHSIVSEIIGLPLPFESENDFHMRESNEANITNNSNEMDFFYID